MEAIESNLCNIIRCEIMNIVMLIAAKIII